MDGLFSKTENAHFFSVPERKSVAVIIRLAPVAIFDFRAEGFEFVEAPEKGGHGDADAAGKSVVAAGGFVVYESVHAAEQFEVFEKSHDAVFCDDYFGLFYAEVLREAATFLLLTDFTQNNAQILRRKVCAESAKMNL